MIILNSTDTIKVILDQNITTSQLQCMSRYRDIDTGVYTPGRNVILTNNTSYVDVVASPASGQRCIDSISIFNNDTRSAVVSIFRESGLNYMTLFKTSLGVGEKIEYAEGKGFRVYTNVGSVKAKYYYNDALSQISTYSRNVLSEDVECFNNTVNSIQPVINLSAPLAINKRYYFKFVIYFTSSSTAEGTNFAIDGPSFSRFNIYQKIATTTTSESYFYNSTNINRTANGVAGIGYNTPIVVATSAASAGNLAVIEGFIQTSNNATNTATNIDNVTLILKAGTDTAAGRITIIRGSYVEWYQLN
jgi:hypothetical protein